MHHKKLHRPWEKVKTHRRKKHLRSQFIKYLLLSLIPVWCFTSLSYAWDTHAQLLLDIDQIQFNSLADKGAGSGAVEVTTSAPAITNGPSQVINEIKAIANKECNIRKLGDYCVKDMLAIAYVESRFNCNIDGDGGKSKGCYQIHLGYHLDISEDQAEDLNFAIHWTLDRMEYHGYPKFRSYAIMKHNGTPFTARTLKYLKDVNKYFNSSH